MGVGAEARKVPMRPPEDTPGVVSEAACNRREPVGLNISRVLIGSMWWLRQAFADQGSVYQMTECTPSCSRRALQLRRPDT
jgi:hypothetical protein